MGWTGRPRADATINLSGGVSTSKRGGGGVGVCTLGCGAFVAATLGCGVGTVVTLGGVGIAGGFVALSVSAVVDAAAVNAAASRASSSRWVSPSGVGKLPCNASVNCFAACISASCTDTDGLVRYLCLENTVSETLTFLVSLFQILKQR